MTVTFLMAYISSQLIHLILALRWIFKWPRWFRIECSCSWKKRSWIQRLDRAGSRKIRWSRRYTWTHWELYKNQSTQGNCYHVVGVCCLIVVFKYEPIRSSLNRLIMGYNAYLINKWVGHSFMNKLRWQQIKGFRLIHLSIDSFILRWKLITRRSILLHITPWWSVFVRGTVSTLLWRTY